MEAPVFTPKPDCLCPVRRRIYVPNRQRDIFPALFHQLLLSSTPAANNDVRVDEFYVEANATGFHTHPVQVQRSSLGFHFLCYFKYHFRYPLLSELVDEMFPRLYDINEI